MIRFGKLETIEEKAVPFKDTFKLKEKIYELKAHKVESKTVPKKEIERKIEIIKKIIKMTKQMIPKMAVGFVLNFMGRIPLW